MIWGALSSFFFGITGRWLMSRQVEYSILCFCYSHFKLLMIRITVRISVSADSRCSCREKILLINMSTFLEMYIYIYTVYVQLICLHSLSSFYGLMSVIFSIWGIYFYLIRDRSQRWATFLTNSPLHVECMLSACWMHVELWLLLGARCLHLTFIYSSIDTSSMLHEVFRF